MKKNYAFPISTRVKQFHSKFQERNLFIYLFITWTKATRKNTVVLEWDVKELNQKQK